jgi:hypothetical protein
MDDLSGGSFVEGYVRGLRGPEVVQQNRQLTGYSDNGSVLSLLPSALSQMEAPATKRRVLSSWSEDVVGALDQETSQVDVAGLGDAELGIAIS